MEITLRDYQQDLLERVQAALTKSTSERVMIQLPTGGGKTEVAGALIGDWLNRRTTHKAVWLTHRVHLQTQTYERLLGTDARPGNPSLTVWERGNPAPVCRNGTAILSANTAGRRAGDGDTGLWSGYSRNDLLVIDEAHHAAAPTWVKAIEQWPGRVVGLTATPSRLAGEVDLANVFKRNLVCGPQISWLQRQGWLCKAEVSKPGPADIIKGGSSYVGGEYNMTDVERVNEGNERLVMTASVLNFWQQHAGGRQTIAYAVTIRHANNLAAVFSVAGIPARAITNQTPAEDRNRAIEGFKSGDIRVLVNVEIATEGFDLPDASCIILARPTLSLSLYLQMVGRGLRRKSDGGNCIILDCAANSDRHGLPDAERRCGFGPVPPGNGNGPTVICPKCRTECPAAVHYCCNQDCGEPFGKDCGRCGKWRASSLWVVAASECYLCRYDRGHGDIPSHEDQLAARILEVERRLYEKQKDLDAGLDMAFNTYIKSLPLEQRPSTPATIGRLFTEWEPAERARLQEEISDLEAERERLTDQLQSVLAGQSV